MYNVKERLLRHDFLLLGLLSFQNLLCRSGFRIVGPKQESTGSSNIATQQFREFHQQIQWSNRCHRMFICVSRIPFFNMANYAASFIFTGSSVETPWWQYLRSKNSGHSPHPRYQCAVAVQFQGPLDISSHMSPDLATALRHPCRNVIVAAYSFAQGQTACHEYGMFFLSFQIKLWQLFIDQLSA